MTGCEHANVAGVLRAAWVAHGGRTRGAEAPFAVDLSSSRLRQALTLADGMRNGQQLGALLAHPPHEHVLDLPAQVQGDAGDVRRPRLGGGFQQGLDLLTRCLIDPGDAVIIDRPGYLGAIQSFQAAGAKLIGWDVLRGDIDELAELLAEDDVHHLAAAMDPGSIAGVIVYENTWAAPFASAARRSGGQLIANGRIPIQAILAAIQADEALAAQGA